MCLIDRVGPYYRIENVHHKVPYCPIKHLVRSAEEDFKGTRGLCPMSWKQASRYSLGVINYFSLSILTPIRGSLFLFPYSILRDLETS